MNAKEKIEELLEASEDGTITAAQVTEAGLHRSVLQEFVKSGEMYRFGRGLYVRSSAWEDDFYLLNVLGFKVRKKSKLKTMSCRFHWAGT